MVNMDVEKLNEEDLAAAIEFFFDRIETCTRQLEQSKDANTINDLVQEIQDCNKAVRRLSMALRRH